MCFFFYGKFGKHWKAKISFPYSHHLETDISNQQEHNLPSPRSFLIIYISLLWNLSKIRLISQGLWILLKVFTSPKHFQKCNFSYQYEWQSQTLTSIIFKDFVDLIGWKNILLFLYYGWGWSSQYYSLASPFIKIINHSSVSYYLIRSPFS